MATKSQMIWRLCAGYVVSVVSATVSLIALREVASILKYFPRGNLMDAAVFISLGMFLTAWPFFLAVCVFGETFRLRNWWYYAGCGAVTGVVLLFWYLQTSPWDEMPPDRPVMPKCSVSYNLCD